jgi:DNA-binding NarL/FixJ family response regulator
MGESKDRGPAAGTRLAGKRCLVVEDIRVIAEREATILERAGARCVIAGTLAEARAATEREPFHVMFVDLRLGHEDGRDLIHEILARGDDGGIVALSAWLDRESAPELWRLGVIAAHKQEAKDLVALAEWAMERKARLRRQGRSVQVSGPLAKCSPAQAFARQFGFTPRERETFNLLLAGLSPKEIACTFGRADSTVRDHIDALCEKVGVMSQCELLALYARGVDDEGQWKRPSERVQRA